MDEIGSAKAWILAFVLFAGGGFGLLVGVGCAIGANSCPFKEQVQQTSTDGRQLFGANCAICHGIQGTGGTGPSLVSGDALELEGADLVAKIARGKPLAGMPRFKATLSPQQMSAIASFIEQVLRSFGASAGATP